MFKIKHLITCLMLVAGLSFGASAQELITDGDFQAQGAAGTPIGGAWTQVGVPGLALVQDNLGDKSALIFGSAGGYGIQQTSAATVNAVQYALTGTILTVSAGATLEIYIDAALQGSFPTATLPGTVYNFLFLGDGATHLIRFNVVGGNTSAIDNVSFAPAAVPEINVASAVIPGGLLLLGLLVLGDRRRLASASV